MQIKHSLITFFAHLRQQILFLLIIIIDILGNGERITKKREKIIYIYTNMEKKKKNSLELKGGIYPYFKLPICY